MLIPSAVNQPDNDPLSVSAPLLIVAVMIGVAIGAVAMLLDILTQFFQTIADPPVEKICTGEASKATLRAKGHAKLKAMFWGARS